MLAQYGKCLPGTQRICPSSLGETVIFSLKSHGEIFCVYTINKIDAMCSVPLTWPCAPAKMHSCYCAVELFLPKILIMKTKGLFRKVQLTEVGG